MHAHTHTLSDCTYCVTQLEEIWVESVSQASDKQIAEETVPGKPMSVFLAEPPKVHRYIHTTFSGFISIYTYLLCNTPTSLHTPQTTKPPLPTLLHTLQLPLTQSPPTSNLPHTPHSLHRPPYSLTMLDVSTIPSLADNLHHSSPQLPGGVPPLLCPPPCL